jgi:hypothetical protein
MRYECAWQLAIDDLMLEARNVDICTLPPVAGLAASRERAMYDFVPRVWQHVAIIEAAVYRVDFISLALGSPSLHRRLRNRRRGHLLLFCVVSLENSTVTRVCTLQRD